MKLYLVTLPNQKTTIDMLTAACQQRNIEVEMLNPAKVNPLTVGIEEGDALYRVSVSNHYGCLELEYSLINPGIATFYAINSLFLLNEDVVDSISLPKFDVPTPKTVNYIPANKTALEECVNALGGLPIIVKALRGQSGVGIMRIDSMQSLFSVGDFLRKQGGIFVLKEFCDAKSTARLIVLGDKVIGSIEYSAGQKDFRSNAGLGCTFVAKQFDAETEEIAVRAAHALGLEYGGVDIMFTDSGPKVAEINFPCFFPDVQMATGIDIAGLMVDYLVEKSRKITGADHDI